MTMWSGRRMTSIRTGVSMTELFTIRQAEERDLFYIQIICREQGLGIIDSITDISVAVNNQDLPVGFIHIETVDDDKDPGANGVYVYPVAVYGSWQHHGVATALVRHELSKTGELRLVACKSSQGFYPKVGFEPVSWELIAARIAHDCDVCGALDDCDPIPFRIKLS